MEYQYLEVKDKRTWTEMELDEGKVLDFYTYFMTRYGLVELHDYYLPEEN